MAVPAVARRSASWPLWRPVWPALVALIAECAVIHGALTPSFERHTPGDRCAGLYIHRRQRRHREGPHGLAARPSGRPLTPSDHAASAPGRDGPRKVAAGVFSVRITSPSRGPGHRERLLSRQIHAVRRLGVLLRLLHHLVVALSFDDGSARTLNHLLHDDLPGRV